MGGEEDRLGQGRDGSDSRGICPHGPVPALEWAQVQVDLEARHRHKCFYLKEASGS